MASIQQKTMQALVKAEKSTGLWLQEVPVPEYGPNDVMIKIHKTAICGTDMHIYNWDEWAKATIPVPMVVGHEYVGIIIAMGSEVKGLEIGDRVSGEGHLTCGHCRNCRAGKRHLCMFQMVLPQCSIHLAMLLTRHFRLTWLERMF